MEGKIIDGFPSTSGDDYQLNTISFLRNAARTFPEVEIVSKSLGGNLVRYNYRLAYNRAQKLANALVGLGIKPGDRVGVMEWNTHRYFELYGAVSGMGAVLLQLNPRLGPDDLAFVLNHSAPKIVFISDSLLPLAVPLFGKAESIEKWVLITDERLDEAKTSMKPLFSYEELLEKEVAHFDWPMVNERSAYSACYTSGTTGKPKGVYYSHRAIYLHTMALAGVLRMGLDDVVLQAVPMFHCHGWGMFFAACTAGAKLVFPGRYTAETIEDLVDLMTAEKVTVSGGAPAIFMPMLKHLMALPEKPDFSRLRMISGATEPPLSMMKGYREFGAEIIHGYGSTETAPLVTVNLLKPSLTSLSEENRETIRTKQGLPMNGVDLKIVDSNGREVPHDGKTVGEILIRGPWVTSSYYNDSRTNDAFTEGYWRSGDAAVIDENGYIKITDRFKDVIKSGGEWISSIDLENSIMAHPDVLEAVVVGVPHPTWEERPLALVVLKGNNPAKNSKNEILEFISPKFAKWQLPDEVVFVDQIPKTSVGKFSKKEIRTTYQDFYTGIQA